MTSVRLFRAFGTTALILVFTVIMAAQTDDQLAAIQAKLPSQFKVTHTTADRSDIVTAGDVVQLHKPGLLMYAVASPMAPANSYKNGKIGQGWGGFGKDLMIGMATPGGGTAADYPHRQFVAEEKCWVTGIQVQKDGILFQLYSDPYDDTRYYANLKIPFPDKKKVPSADAAAQLVAEVLTVVPQDDQEGQTAPEGTSAPPADPAQAGQQGKISGKYLSGKNGAELIFVSDTSVILLVPGADQNRGQFSVNGDALSIKFPNDRHPINFKIQGEKLVSDKGTVWDRKGGAPAPVDEVAAEPSNGQAQVIPGQYFTTGGSHLLLLSDSSFTKFVGGGQGHGQYAVDGDNVTLTFTSTGFSQHFKIQNGNLLDVNTHQQWVRTGDAPGSAAATPADLAATQAPLSAIAPPPPPADAPPPTVTVGQSKDQVTAILGQPVKAAKVGAKEIFYYKDMKVTFINGKVGNIE